MLDDVKSYMSLANSYKMLNSIGVLQNVVMDYYLVYFYVWSNGYIVESVYGLAGYKDSQTSNSMCLVNIPLLG